MGRVFGQPVGFETAEDYVAVDETFTASTTWVCPMTGRYDIGVKGAGGGGASGWRSGNSESYTSAGGGGGGEGDTETELGVLLFKGDEVGISIGTRGLGGTTWYYNNSEAGDPGGDSSVTYRGNTITAPGGLGGGPKTPGGLGGDGSDPGETGGAGTYGNGSTSGGRGGDGGGDDGGTGGSTALTTDNGDDAIANSGCGGGGGNGAGPATPGDGGDGADGFATIRNTV